ncbi:amino acid ABC transporter substrate-binding protein [Bradyrhizobium sp. INPA01-394B]|uniref:Amino acid ABC transporter substrate-binding protein n=1 Tax=Bradyrhizobium campsiandrae TaxID=1729892 RepID=A0ABR7UH17_9BRAD|nr:amino acid ABC transporter substrate-binding protein [Bradyrhizobium campsiandrae]MBC9879013.1 amino acid ABC transporter substrate-binding protein [Bradyrhizobium campsiandrae]MBC9982881.1 amino acid ABC transporter substrate-binding protein [Bradyrhizobium campsiandrae]
MRPRRSGMMIVASIAMMAGLAAPASAEQGPGNSIILKRILERGAINIGHREASAPFSYVNDEQKVEGYSIDLCMKAVDAIRQRLSKPDLKVTFTPINVTNRIPLVANGTVDLECGTTSNFLTRQEQVEFSPIYYVTGTQLLVKSASAVREIEDLKGKRVAALQGSSNEAAVRKLNDEKALGVQLVYVKDLPEGALLVENDRVDAFVADGIQIKVYAATKARPAGSLAVVGRLLTYDPYSAMMQRGDQDFSLLVRGAFADAFRSGEAETIYARWFDPLGLKIEGELLAAFRVQALPR